jgi:hypothetical protein
MPMLLLLPVLLNFIHVFLGPVAYFSAVASLAPLLPMLILLYGSKVLIDAAANEETVLLEVIP